MAIAKLALTLSTLCVVFQYISGHGRMVDPLSRASLWRLKTYNDVPTNYEDNQMFCGGYGIQHGYNHGKCGTCGDAYRNTVPRSNENGGRFGKGHVVKSYRSGEKVQVKIKIDTNHEGYFTFSICKLPSPTAVETEECFDHYPLQLINEKGQRGDRYSIFGSKTGVYPIDVFLPKGLKCDRCVLRWHYTTGNFWGVCKGSKPGGRQPIGRKGCGPQENYRNCADVSIE